MSLRHIPWFVPLLTLLTGCGPKPAPTPPVEVPPVVVAPEPRKVTIKPVPMAAEDWKTALPRNYERPLRGGKTDEELARELEREAFAFEFSGGSFEWWFDVDEVGQSTISGKRAGSDWRVEATDGLLVVSVGRMSSQKTHQTAEKDAFAGEVSFDVRVPKYMGGNFTHIFQQNPLWYGWSGNKTVRATPHTIDAARVGDTVSVLTLECEEPMPVDKAKPRKVTVTLKAKFVAAADGK